VFESKLTALRQEVSDHYQKLVSTPTTQIDDKISTIRYCIKSKSQTRSRPANRSLKTEIGQLIEAYKTEIKEYIASHKAKLPAHLKQRNHL